MSGDQQPAPTAMVAVVTFDRIARTEGLRTEIVCASDADLEDGLRDFAARYLRSPRFLVEVDADVVRLSSGKPGFPAGDFGAGRVTWTEPS